MIYEGIHWKRIEGHERYKYQLIKDVLAWTGIFSFNIETKYYRMRTDGTLLIKSGYAWDGSSGPTWDSNNTMLPSLVHDVGYQILRVSEMIPPEGDYSDYNKLFEKYRLLWDEVYHDKLIETGTWRLRAWWHYKGVRLFGRKSALPEYLK